MTINSNLNGVILNYFLIILSSLTFWNIFLALSTECFESKGHDIHKIWVKNLLPVFWAHPKGISPCNNLFCVRRSLYITEKIVWYLKMFEYCHLSQKRKEKTCCYKDKSLTKLFEGKDFSPN